MLPPVLLREDIDQVVARLKTRGFVFDQPKYVELEQQRKTLQVNLEQLQAQRNTLSKAVGVAKGQGKPADDILAELQVIKQKMTETSELFEQNKALMEDFVLGLPNLPAHECPIGTSEADNVVVSQHGSIKSFDFEPKDHVELGERLNLFRFQDAAAISGARFTVMAGQLATLHRALISWMLDHHIAQNGYTEFYVPCLTKPEALYGTGQLPKFGEDIFMTADQEFALISTGEIPLTNLVKDKILSADGCP